MMIVIYTKEDEEHRSLLWCSTSDLVIDSNGNSDDNGDDDGVKSIDHFCGVDDDCYI